MTVNQDVRLTLNSVQHQQTPTMTQFTPLITMMFSVQTLRSTLHSMTGTMVGDWSISLTFFKIFCSAYVPYCSSDVYTGTRMKSDDTNGLYFYGHYIVRAILDDLIQNTWISEAEEVIKKIFQHNFQKPFLDKSNNSNFIQVVLMGSSAGGEGTDANCDFVADTLHSVNPNIKVKCISDSGSIYPLNTHSEDCDPKEVLLSFFETWEGVSDESCLEQHPDGKAGCLR